MCYVGPIFLFYCAVGLVSWLPATWNCLVSLLLSRTVFHILSFYDLLILFFPSKWGVFCLTYVWMYRFETLVTSLVAISIALSSHFDWWSLTYEFWGKNSEFESFLFRQVRENKSPRKMALRRVLNFALDLISFFFENWRLVVHRLGSPGKGELKGIWKQVKLCLALFILYFIAFYLLDFYIVYTWNWNS